MIAAVFSFVPVSKTVNSSAAPKKEFSSQRRIYMTTGYSGQLNNAYEECARDRPCDRTTTCSMSKVPKPDRWDEMKRSLSPVGNDGTFFVPLPGEFERRGMFCFCRNMIRESGAAGRLTGRGTQVKLE
jgi:hypothetical protein